MNRQDLVGFSSESEPSQYALLGPPGWTHGPLGQPHPDYWSALLFKQVVGTAVLRSTYASPDDPAGIDAGWDSHVWCARAGGGAVVVTFTNLLGRAVNVTVGGRAAGRRVEYILTSTSAPVPGDAPPPSLYANAVYLNGALLTTDAAGGLPAWPLPGRAAEGPAVVPPWSYGAIVVLDAGAACA